MLTINADEHPVFNRLHRPGEEKRMVVILDEADYDGWLEAPPARMGDYLKPFPAELLHAEPAPRR
jgi:putative SOS response-associated peptidase YedK